VEEYTLVTADGEVVVVNQHNVTKVDPKIGGKEVLLNLSV